ncbi:MAG: hypothetical protein HY527_22000 [Betaproteobacteria bacterium]|nr:hypothetical protein [Betaproteobacteria bacterium]
MKARLLFDQRIVIAEKAFAELVLWEVPTPVSGSPHRYKYRLAFIVDGRCELRYDNETGKGDHRHAGDHEEPYQFTTPDQLVADFFLDIERWRNENRDS